MIFKVVIRPGKLVSILEDTSQHPVPERVDSAEGVILRFEGSNWAVAAMVAGQELANVPRYGGDAILPHGTVLG